MTLKYHFPYLSSKSFDKIQLISREWRLWDRLLVPILVHRRMQLIMIHHMRNRYLIVPTEITKLCLMWHVHKLQLRNKLDAGVLLRREMMQESVKSMPNTIALCVLVNGYVNNKFFEYLKCLIHWSVFYMIWCTWMSVYHLLVGWFQTIPPWSSSRLF
jgi:hypothetical protein